MCAWSELVPTAEEKAQRYYEGIDLGGSLYDADAPDIPDELPDQEQHRAAGPRDTEGLFSGPRDIEGLFSGPVDMEVCSPDAMIWTLRIPDVLIRRVQELRVAVGVGGYDSVCPETLDLEVIRTERAAVAVGVPGGVARYEPQVGKNINTALFNFSRLNCFNTNRFRNPFKAGTVKSLK